MKTTACRISHFNAAHRLYNVSWTDEENLKVFGKCSNPLFHGHNYKLVVCLEGEVDPKTGFVYDLAKLQKIIDNHVISLLDHKNLNLELDYFKETNPTTENISKFIWNKIKNQVNENYKVKIVLYETEKNFVEYSE